jgi:hypothetical protein
VNRSRFRGLLVAYWLLFAIAAVLTKSGLPPELRTYVESHPFTRVQAGAGAVALLLSIFITIGLFLYKSWARYAYVGLLIASYLLTPWTSPLVESKWIISCYFLLNTISGALVVAMFWSPVSTEFTPRPPGAA